MVKVMMLNERVFTQIFSDRDYIPEHDLPYPYVPAFYENQGLYNAQGSVSELKEKVEDNKFVTLNGFSEVEILRTTPHTAYTIRIREIDHVEINELDSEFVMIVCEAFEGTI